jgi:replicative DNA helicase
MESEQIVLASCLKFSDGSKFDEVSQVVHEHDFFLETHQVIYNTIKELALAGDPVDEISLLEKLRSNGKEGFVGGLTYIYEILDATSTGMKGLWAAKQVKEKSKLRQLIRTCRLSIESAEEQSEDSENLCSTLETNVSKINLSYSDDFDIKDTIQRVRDNVYSNETSEYIPTGIQSYDNSLKRNGFGPGQICIVAARPGKGKTTFAMNVALRAALDDKAVGIFSLEMGDDELIEKMCSTLSGVQVQKIYDKVASKQHMDKFNDCMDEISNLNILIEERADTFEKVASKARYWKRKFDMKLMVVDYIQLMKGEGTRRDEQISSISRSLKSLARQLKIPIIVVAQLNRESEKEDRQPRLSDLGDSSSLERDADSVTFLYTLKTDYIQTEKLRWCRPKQRAGQSYAEGEFEFVKQCCRIRDFVVR